MSGRIIVFLSEVANNSKPNAIIGDSMRTFFVAGALLLIPITVLAKDDMVAQR
jgi:hypothetical protein